MFGRFAPFVVIQRNPGAAGNRTFSRTIAKRLRLATLGYTLVPGATSPPVANIHDFGENNPGVMWKWRIG
jgi:hypothetical protein